MKDDLSSGGKNLMKKIGIKGTGSVLPERVIPNSYLKRLLIRATSGLLPAPVFRQGE
jgi:hypothetical protein